MTVGLRMLLL